MISWFQNKEQTPIGYALLKKAVGCQDDWSSVFQMVDLSCLRDIVFGS